MTVRLSVSILLAGCCWFAGTAVAQQVATQQPAAQQTATPQQTSIPVTRTCVPPVTIPAIPDGKSADQAKMQAAHTAMKAYVDAGQAFIDCVDNLVRGQTSNMSVSDYLRVDESREKMVGNMQILADQFNTQLRAFRAGK